MNPHSDHLHVSVERTMLTAGMSMEYYIDICLNLKAVFILDDAEWHLAEWGWARILWDLARGTRRGSCREP